MKLMKFAIVFAFALTLAPMGWAQTAAPRVATLAQQKMCDQQAHKKFDEDYDTNDTNKRGYEYVYTSHYDAHANVCYMLVHGNAVRTCCTVSYVVYDAFEGRVYASYIWISTQAQRDQLPSSPKYYDPMECSVKPRGGAEITCKSSEEFEILIDKHFGIGWQ